MYRLIRPILFKIDPETTHKLTLSCLNVAHRLGLLRLIKKPTTQPRRVMGLNFPNPIGLAAGFDKNGDYIEALFKLGFGFIEIGTVTPKPQAGHPRPRIFRLIKHKAIINRLGFNNKGMDYVASRLEKSSYKGILGINIGKNAATDNDNAVQDYLACFNKLAPYASYITINISSPNTHNLRDLHQETSLTDLLSQLKKAQSDLLQSANRYVPLVVKLSPDLTDEALTKTADVLLQQKIDGVITTNTTISRDHVDSKYADLQGGLSGAPLTSLSSQMTQKLHEKIGNQIPIIAVGGIMNAENAREKFKAGASLVQLYTGLVYAGPRLIKDCASNTTK